LQIYDLADVVVGVAGAAQDGGKPVFGLGFALGRVKVSPSRHRFVARSRIRLPMLFP